MQADLALSQQNGESSSSLTSILISIYKAFGQLLIAANENALAKVIKKQKQVFNFAKSEIASIMISKVKGGI